MVSKKLILVLSFLSIHCLYGAPNSISAEALQEVVADYNVCITALETRPADFKGKEVAIGQSLSYQSIEHFINEPDVFTELKRKFIAEAHKKEILIPVTPTDAMLMAYDDRVKSYLRTMIEEHPKLLPFLTHLIEQENHERNNHNHVFYHGLRKDIYMLMYIHTKILDLISPINANFLMLRSPLDTYSPLYLPSILRSYFVKNGSKDGDWTSRDRYHLLSANHSIFGNGYNTGECTFYYFFNNHSVQSISTSYKDIFAYYNIEDLYKTVEQELEKLTINSPSGVLLQISLDKALSQKVSYLSKPGGYKTTLSSKKSFFAWTNNQNDLTHIITRPGAIDDLNCRQWRLVLTDDLLLNPYHTETRNGLKITAYTLEQEALTEFHTKVDAIFATLKKKLTQEKRTIIKPVKKGWFQRSLTWPLQKLHINGIFDSFNKKSLPSLISNGLLITSGFFLAQLVHNEVSRKKYLTNKQEIQKIFIAAIALVGFLGFESI